jgi:RNA polymerase sigma-70 factor (ECF subfamily)
MSTQYSPRHSHDDPALQADILLFQKGDMYALERIYKKFQQSVYSYCARMMGNKSEAKDAIQEVFLRVIDYKESAPVNHFPAWLFRITRTVCLNLIRKKRNYEEFNDEIYTITSNYREQDFSLKDVLDNALMQLPPTLREVVILREYEGYSYQEIAVLLDIDLSLVKVRIHRARLTLRKILEPIAGELRFI